MYHQLCKLLFIIIVFFNQKTFAFTNIPIEKNLPIKEDTSLNTTPLFTQIAPICSGETLILPSVSNNGFTGTWSPAINNTQTTTYTFTPNAGQNAVSTTMTVEVNPVPIITSNGNTFTICSGESTNVILSSSNPNTTYIANVVSNGVIGAVSSSGPTFNNTILTLTSENAGTVVYTIYPMIGNCFGPSITITVNVNPVPFGFPGLTTTICSGEYTNVTFNSTFQNTTFNWVVNSFSGVSGFSNGSGNLINDLLYTTGTSQGTVTYTVTPRIGNCIGNSVIVTANVSPLPNNTITQSGATLTSNQAGASYQWYKCSNFPIAGANTQSYLATEIGDYKVEVMDISNGCMNTSNCINVNTLDVKSFDTLSNFIVYPNPVESILTIENKYAIEKIEIFNLLGQSILSQSINLNTTNIDLTNLSSGTYVLRVFSENSTINHIIYKK